MRRQLAAAFLTATFVLLALAGTATGAGSLQFVDPRGNSLSVDTGAGSFVFTYSTYRVTGTSTAVRGDKRFTIYQVGNGQTLIAIVDPVRKTASATLLETATGHWISSMRDVRAGSPTFTPTLSPTRTQTPTSVPSATASNSTATATPPGATVFLDRDGNSLAIDVTAQTFRFTSGAGTVVGTSDTIKPRRRFSIAWPPQNPNDRNSRGPSFTAIVDLNRLRATATLIDATSHRWLASMRDAGTSLPILPTATPLPASDAWRATGAGTLSRDPGRTFKLDVFRNGTSAAEGIFEYHDLTSRFHFSATSISELIPDDGIATIRGIGTTLTRGSAEFELTVTVSGAVPTFDLKVRGFGYATTDTVIAGQVDVAGHALVLPTATSTRTPTSLPTYTPTRTPTSLPTATPRPTFTPTRAVSL